MKIEDIKLVMTCEVCPEQYKAMVDGKQVAYLRLRHGIFTVEAPDCGGVLILKTFPIGDGCFVENERAYFLTRAKELIVNYYKRHKRFKKIYDNYEL